MIKNIFVILWVVAFGIMLNSSVWAEDASMAGRNIDRAIESAEEMVVHLQEGHLGIFEKHARDFMIHVRAAQRELPKGDELGDRVIGHLQAAMAEAEKTIEHSKAGHEETALKHALSALSHTEEAYSLSGAL